MRMSAISNIWKHPKTSATGLLIAVVTISGVLSQQGITLGSAGTGTVITLVSGIATAFLGMMARDPSSSSSNSTTGSTAKLGVWALIALLVTVPFQQGCNGKSVAQDIVNWTPALESAVATVDSTAAVMDPADAMIFAAATAGFDAAANLLVVQARAYLDNKNASTMAQLQTQIVTFQQQVNASLLAAARITNTTNQQHALTAINGVATIVTAVLALVTSISGKAVVAQMATQSTIKLAAVEPYLDKNSAARIVALHYDEPVAVARIQVAQVESAAVLDGF
jgi:hypothetical protein